ncbi:MULTISPECIES: cellulase [Streptomyces]|uniref:Cellulase n=1 Tax=Streptomyces koelreuteriae TaxID=2838015 RepID=A0ABX8G369_9ACTN|nr:MULTISPECIES: cellulase [Streptomyces]QWB27791.1 cellulase [Streptomyces koelreuteriae]UUA10896.1 cellulase [Streptomyces koelreuteriae]UUA18502.1 cellulase [Streptomyces sp. CRCS-T-1]
MDDFERDLSRLMRDTQQHTPYEPAQRQRLHQGIRARRRSRMLWKAGGSAVAVAGLSVGLALLPGMLTKAQPADPRPQPATSPTPTHDDGPTTGAPDPSPPPTGSATSVPATSPGSSTPTGTTSSPAGPPPTATPSESSTTTTFPSAPPPPTRTSAPPSALETTQEPSASVSSE